MSFLNLRLWRHMVPPSEQHYQPKKLIPKLMHPILSFRLHLVKLAFIGVNGVEYQSISPPAISLPDFENKNTTGRQVR